MKRLRILAGPNGSGKTSIYLDLQNSFRWGIFVNADDIELVLKTTGKLDLSTYGSGNITYAQFAEAYSCSTQTQKSSCPISNMDIVDGVLIIKDSHLLDSYVSAFVASFIQSVLMNEGVSFSMETVMSHPSKLDLMRLAKEKGYRVYLYYVSTPSPDINVARVQTRVAEGGHNVDENKIRSRYIRSLDQLFDAIKLTDRAYLFDNGRQRYEWIAEYDGETHNLKVFHKSEWLTQYVLNKI